MRFSARNPRGVHADSRAPIPSHPIPSQRTKTSAARRRAPILVALTHETLKADTVTSIADLADLVKTEAARLRIPYTGDTVAAAIRSVLSRRDMK